MSLGKSIFGIGEVAIRAKELNLRRFWQQDSNIPTYVRRKYDGIFFGLTCFFVGTAFVASINSSKQHILKEKN
ncbi:UNVERIFIED_CONTAM: hypothetical protein HDU68_005937 [Siphonaria sp. JEL0065]|nr:hypothetical protein HDU68_005937 [Siphonaria sp. JEL0065]